MTTTIYWYDDQQTILYYQAQSSWTWSDFYHLMSQICQMTANKPAPVHIIADFTECPSLPKDALLHFRSLSDQLPDNIGIVAMVGVRPIIRYLYTTFARIYAKLTQILDMRFVNTLDEALELFSKKDV